MPRGDGTGPRGTGPRTGRGLGDCPPGSGGSKEGSDRGGGRGAGAGRGRGGGRR